MPAPDDNHDAEAHPTLPPGAAVDDDQFDADEYDRETPIPSSLEKLELWDREGLAPKSFVVALLVATAALVYVFLPFVHDVMLAFVVVGLFGPLYRKLLPTIKNRWLCSAVITMLAIAVVAGPVVWLAFALLEEATNAYTLARPSIVDGSAPQALQQLLSRVGFDVSQAEVTAFLKANTEHIRDFAIAQATALVNNIISAVVHSCLIVVLVFYLFADGPKLKQFLFMLSPLPDDQDALIVDKFTTVVRSVLIGNGIGSVLQGVVGGVALALVGLPSPVLWGTVMSIAAFLPLFGISLVVVPAGVYLILLDRTAEGVIFMAVCLSLALVIENVLKTKLMGAGVRVHDIPLFLGILGGLAGFGLIGLLYGPLIVAIFLTLTELYLTHYRPQFAARFLRRELRRRSG